MSTIYNPSCMHQLKTKELESGLGVINSCCREGGSNEGGCRKKRRMEIGEKEEEWSSKHYEKS